MSLKVTEYGYIDYCNDHLIVIIIIILEFLFTVLNFYIIKNIVYKVISKGCHY